MKAFHEVRSYGSDFMVWCQTYEDISFLSHWHKEIELIYISAGSRHVLAVNTDGDVFAWGDNSDGQLGIGETEGLSVS